MTDHQPLFLVGAQRSGTTALAHALSAAFAAHGGCFTVNGKLFYLTARWLRPGDVRDRHLRADEMAHALDRRPVGGYDARAWRARLDAALQIAARQAADGRAHAGDRPDVALARQIAAAAYGDGPWGDKYNEYLLDLPYLDRLYPDARWLFVCRHPVEVAMSMLAWSGDRPWRPADAAGCERKWTEWNSRWLAFRDRIPPARRLEINYDTLCTGGGVTTVSRFVGFRVAADAMQRRTPATALEPHTGCATEIWSRLRGLVDVTLSA